MKEIDWDEALTRRGIKLIPHTPAPGESYWKLVEAHYWREKEHIFVRTLGEDGQPMAGAQVRFWWGEGRGDQATVKTTEVKPEWWMADYPMYAAGWSYSVEMLGHPSDRVTGLGLGTPEQPDWKIHVSWKLTFQLVKAGVLEEPDQREIVPVSLYWDGVDLRFGLDGVTHKVALKE